MAGFEESIPTRRLFMRRFAPTAFITPLIVSFTLDGVAVADNTDRSRQQLISVVPGFIPPGGRVLVGPKP
jgi:hypothetical protein